jgi:hypothetical protein
VPKPSCGFSSDRERPIFSLSRANQETTMPDELAAEKGAGSDAVSTLSNYLAIREAVFEGFRQACHALIASVVPTPAPLFLCPMDGFQL